MPRYRFGEFLLSPRRRLLLRHGDELPLIPRYFDLLVFLIERRQDAVHRQEIFDRVWGDVVVSDSALSQAIRTIRRAFDDDSRDPRYVRTVSRHGYRFVYLDVVEEEDDDTWPVAGPPSAPGGTVDEAVVDRVEPLLERITKLPAGALEEEDRREAAELLHELGTADALARLGDRPGHARGRALLRDTRWDVVGAGPVPILRAPSAASVVGEVARLRLRRAAALAAARWGAASIGAGASGLAAGAAGGLILAAVPDGAASPAVVPVLALVGAACGGAGGAGVGAGLAAAESIVRSRRVLALLVGAALGGGLAGLVVQWLGRWTLEALVGIRLATGGALAGLVIGGAAGLGYGLATRRSNGGLAAPRGRARILTVAAVAACCGAATLALTLGGQPLVGGTLHTIAQASAGGQTTLAPLGRLIGEPDFGHLTAALIGTGEGCLFGIGLALGLTHRSHRTPT